MSKRILCKFFAHGACLKGEHCEYAHDWKAPPNNICTFYQRGACAYGSRCRYDHVKISRSQPCTSSSSTSSWGSPVSGASIPPTAPVVSDPAELSATATPIPPPSKPAWDQQCGNLDVSDNNGTMEYKSDNLADQAICSFAAAGSCPRGEICPHVHGDLCSICGKHCLHPFRLEEREEHTTVCEKRQKHLEVLRQSQEIECSVCLERVLSKPTTAERKFGLLSECDHPFCITCIRNWRNCSPSSSMDVNSTLRACPICRKLSYFVIPSVIWYFSKAEKQEIVDSYKAKLKSIDCKYFDFGNGTCPFGTSCFYKHIVKPGLRCKRNFNPSTSSMPHRRSSLYDDDTLRYTDLDTFFTLLDAEDLVCEALASEMAFLQEFEELEKKYSGDYDEEDFLTPWQRSFLWSQLGYDRDEFDYWSDGDFDDSDDNDDS